MVSRSVRFCDWERSVGSVGLYVTGINVVEALVSIHIEDAQDLKRSLATLFDHTLCTFCK